MRALNLDYGVASRLSRWIGMGLLVAGLGMALLVAYRYRSVTAETANWNSRAAQSHNTQRATVARPTQGLEHAALEVGQAVNVVAQLALPWEALFEAVETTGTEQVALLSIEPDASQQTVKITGEAKNLASMLDYQRQLGQQALFKDVHLEHHEVAQQDAEKPVRFIMVATWQS